MTDIGNETDVPQGPVPGFEQVLALTHEHGGTANIPDEALIALGYFRTVDGTLAPVGYEVKTRTLKEKNAQKPFEPFSVLINTDKSPRVLDEGLRNRVEHIDADIKFIVGYRYGNEPQLKNIASKDEMDRASWLASALCQTGAKTNGERLYRKLNLFGLTEYYSPIYGIPKGANEREAQDRIRDLSEDLLNVASDYYGQDIWPDEAAIMISDVAEKERGKLADVDELYKQYDHNLGFEKVPGMTMTTPDEPDEDTYADYYTAEDAVDMHAELERYDEELNSAGIDTQGKFMMLVIGEILDDMFPGTRGDSFANDTLSLSSSAQAAAYLKDLESSLQIAARQQLKTAKEHLRQVPYGDPERSAAEEQLRTAKQTLKAPHNQLLPLIEAFERPQLVARRLNGLFDDLQEILYASGDDSRTYKFVSDIDTQLDADPGKISGDCTVNRPLPFLDPNNSLYNVKVFRENDHVGNIYLLEVKGRSGQPLIWHFDAIQIPQFIDWSEAARAILAGFKQQAKARGVKRITINEASQHISNYNYISEAFRTLGIESVPNNSKLFKAVRKAAPPAINDDPYSENSDLQLHHSNAILRLA